MKNEEKQQEFGHELHPHSVQEMDAKALLFKKKSNKSQKEKQHEEDSPIRKKT
ncbi:hypothetical protein [Halalkalibacter hemicellulosilyticus]|uniref:Uncharacterized protein n=1 Tax=Halalkalibacter hemicellulosilyticusJCM 9152 TaxID=1236971 RepID=W4QCX4_9BACI|nr:hypothetical protein [Halalkalibacter hemicellulosilyticus]GAE29229.1 hypothetical protein JCM9152_574 [Halalkalibacter hemicellulosilyticusJCM 9152]